MGEREEPQDDDRDQRHSEDKDRDDGDRDERERVYDLNDPKPEPGVTAPLDHVTEEEGKSGPVGVMPGAGPDPDDARHSGVEAQDAREEQKEGRDQQKAGDDAEENGEAGGS